MSSLDIINIWFEGAIKNRLVPREHLSLKLVERHVDVRSTVLPDSNREIKTESEIVLDMEYYRDDLSVFQQFATIHWANTGLLGLRKFGESLASCGAVLSSDHKNTNGDLLSSVVTEMESSLFCDRLVGLALMDGGMISSTRVIKASFIFGSGPTTDPTNTLYSQRILTGIGIYCVAHDLSAFGIRLVSAIDSLNDYLWDYPVHE